MSNDAIRSQFQAALSMMQQAVEECPLSLWNRGKDKNKYWQVAYHALFFTHLYLQPALQEFTPWDGHIPESENLGLAPDSMVKGGEINMHYRKEDVLNYLAFCRQQVDNALPKIDPNAESGFHWLPISKLELQFYSMRHLQLHTGELAERLYAAFGIEVGWVSKGS